MGPIGPKGQDGLDGQEGGTPFLLTNPFSGFIQYGDGDATLPLGETRVVAPADGHFLTRAYFSGTVAKRDGAARCRVQVRLHKATEVDPLALEDIGIMGAPLAGKIETSVSATLVTKINVTAGEAVDLRLEAQRRDDECANGAGAEQVAQIIGQLEVSFFHVPIVQQ